MLTPTPTTKPANVIAFAFLMIAFLSGIASSFQIPTLSLFLSQEIQVSPVMVGTFYSINAVMGIFLSQILAKYSDKQEDRRKIITICCLIAMAGCLIFAFSRNYYVLAFLGTFLLGLGSSSNPQSFALAREYAQSTGREAVMFTTIMRTQISLAWIVGPPLSFSIALGWGFTYMYIIAALAFVLCAAICQTLLPKISYTQLVEQTNETKNHGELLPSDRRSVAFLFTACFLIWSCNGMYLINMPLYVIHELNLPERLAGILMGTAAGLEIPIMLIAGYLTKYFRKKSLMTAALIAGFLFYAGLLFCQQTWELVGLQLLNAMLIGITATIGMVYFQDLMPEKMGSATTLFSNAARSSWIVSGPLAGLIAQLWDYNSVFYISVAMLVIAVIAMIKVKSM